MSFYAVDPRERDAEMYEYYQRLMNPQEPEYEEPRSDPRVKQLERRVAELEEESLACKTDVSTMTLAEFAQANQLRLQPYNESWLLMSQLVALTADVVREADVQDQYTLETIVPFRSILVSREYEEKKAAWVREGNNFRARASSTERDISMPCLKYKCGLLFLSDERAFSLSELFRDGIASRRCIILKSAMEKLSRHESGYASRQQTSSVRRMRLE